MATVTLPTLDPSVLLNYYAVKLAAPAATTSAGVTASSQKTATSADSPPWENLNPPSQQTEDAVVLNTTKFLDLSKVPSMTGSNADQKTEQDNQKLFALYSAVNSLYYLSEMAGRDGMTSGQLAGLNTRFKSGLSQIESYISTTTFNNFTMQTGQTSASATSKVAIPFPAFNYTGATISTDGGLANALPGVSATDSFDVSITENGSTTAVPIDLSHVQGTLSLDNIVTYINQQISAAGFSTRFSRVMTSGSIDDPTKATYGIAITAAPSEKVSLSSAVAAPALYIAGSTGSATGSGGSAPNQQGRLIKLTDLDGAPQTAFNASATPDSGTSAAQSTVVDGDGNVYVVGNATGDFGDQLNQGTQDVYLSKYDSAGNLQWTKLLGSAGSASGYGLAVDPTGGVVVTGSTTADLTTAAVADGNTDSFVAKYDGDGNQLWVNQIPTLNNNQASAISVDSSGNVYIGGQTSGIVGAGQTSSGGKDAYLAKLDNKGKIVSEQQFGSSGDDRVAATAFASDGSLVVATLQNGHAVLTKYANGDMTAAPAWSQDMGDLQNGGAIGGLTISGDKIYLSGNSTNGNLTVGGQASIANASSGGTDAFVIALTDNGSSVSADHVSYVGTSGTEKAGALTVGPDGTIYLTGSTSGTFAGQTRTVANTNNLFVSAVAADGSIGWTKQYGGASGQSAGTGIAIDASGSSVLDALGLPRGPISVNQSVDLASQSTLRPGDSFNIQIQGTGARTAKITIDKGETLNSLANKINIALLNTGKASVTYANGGEALQIKMNAGVTATLVSGPKDFDALARLGIDPGTLTAPAKGGAPTTAKSNATAKSTFGLGFTGSMDLSTTTGAKAAKAQLLNVLSAIRNAYRTSNAPAGSAGTTTAQSSGPAPAYLTQQVASYTLALNMLLGGSSASTTA